MDQTSAPDFTPFYDKILLASEEASGRFDRFRISKETADALNLRIYDPATMPEAHRILEELTGSDPVQAPTLIVPFDSTYWIGVTDNIEGSIVKPRVPAEARAKLILGADDLYTVDRSIWLAFTAADWLALKALGIPAVYIEALAERELLERLTAKPPTKPVICIPPDDTDNARGSCDGMADKIRRFGIPATVPNVPEFWRGPFRVYTINPNPDEFQEFVERTEGAVSEGRTAEKELYRMASAGGLAERFLDRVRTADRADAIPSGLEALDEQLDGGLYPGLYILGAVSSLGKTSLMLQIADSISDGGQDVLFFTAEQSPDELMAKSLSRITGEMASDLRGDVGLNSLRILRGAPTWTKMESDALEKAAERYRDMAGHLWIIEADSSREADGRGSGTRIGLDTIEKAVKEHIELMGTRPVVIIDYLQILQPSDQTGKKSDKQNMDETVSELRRLSKEYRGGIPIIAISSLNRASYGGTVGMDSYKESGAIEYSADVILALQPRNLSTGTTPTDQKRNKEAYQSLESCDTKLLEIHVMKNRMGRRGKVPLEFDARYGIFRVGSYEDGA